MFVQPNVHVLNIILCQIMSYQTQLRIQLEINTIVIKIL